MTSATPHPARSRLAGEGLPAGVLDSIDNESVPTRNLPTGRTSVSALRAAGWHRDDLWLPAVVLHEPIVQHNLERFHRWCAEAGVEIAPHGKTTMSPHLWSAQLDRGVWGLSAATVAQARVMRDCGVSRVLIANEVIDPDQIRWLAEQLADPTFEPLCLVDSTAGVQLLERHLAGAERSLTVLVELGVPEGRTGVREPAEAVELARRVAASPQLRLAGIEGYEGALPQRRDGSAPEDARAWLSRLRELVVRADEAGVFADNEEILLTAGGSAFPDLAADEFRELPTLSRPVRRVIRSGCYITHDDLSYERKSPLRSEVADDPLRPALSCYARVLSYPEPGRVLLGVGKRDVAFDSDLPVPRAVLRHGERHELHGTVRLVKLNDHHAFCDVTDDVLEVGDVLELGLSHPCTVFDKWPLIPVVDATGHVVDAIRTLF